MPHQALTDRQQVEELLDSLDIEYYADGPFFIRLKEGMNRVGGYPGHGIVFEFTRQGRLVEVGAYT